MCPTFSFTVGEGVQKETKMRFWILAAIALMLAGDVIAAPPEEPVVGVNTSTLRRIKITNGNYHMELTILSEVEPVTGLGQVPFIYTSSLIVNGRVPAHTVNPWNSECPEPGKPKDPVNPLCDLSRNLWYYVLSLEIGQDGVKHDVLLLQPQMNSFGTFDGNFSAKVYLADNEPGSQTDADPYPWGSRVMTERVDIEVRRETYEGDVLGVGFKGTFDANQ
jgi:hypothetical protein